MECSSKSWHTNHKLLLLLSDVAWIWQLPYVQISIKVVWLDPNETPVTLTDPWMVRFLFLWTSSLICITFASVCCCCCCWCWWALSKFSTFGKCHSSFKASYNMLLISVAVLPTELDINAVLIWNGSDSGIYITQLLGFWSLPIIHILKAKRKQRFGNWICFCQVRARPKSSDWG
jgi:hypothetical protein